MNAITLGNPNLFVKGMVEVVITDPVTGNIIGYDNVSTESAVTTSVNMGEISGGFGNPVLINIPDTTRISGTLTSQAFSLKQRALTSGGKLSGDGVVSVCETVTAVGSTITVTRTPAKAYGQLADDLTSWCYVREHGAGSYIGTNFGVNLTTKVVNFTAESGKQYDVMYFVSLGSAEVLSLPASFNPSIATIKLKFGVYAKQNNSVSNGTLQGYMYFIVPRAQFSGDAGMGANQTSNATTNYDWTAVMPDQNMMACSDCGTNDTDYAYYVYAPCDTSSMVEDLVIVGGGVQVAVGGDAQIPVKYILNNGSLAQADYTALTYLSDTTSKATVDTVGVVHGVAAGDAEIAVSLAKSDGTTLVTYCNVKVVSA